MVGPTLEMGKRICNADPRTNLVLFIPVRGETANKWVKEIKDDGYYRIVSMY